MKNTPVKDVGILQIGNLTLKNHLNRKFPCKLLPSNSITKNDLLKNVIQYLMKIHQCLKNAAKRQPKTADGQPSVSQQLKKKICLLLLWQKLYY